MPLPTREELETRYGRMVAEQQAREAEAARGIAQAAGGFVSGVGTGLMDQLRGFRDIAQKGGQYAQNYINDIAMMRDPTRNLPGYTDIARLGEMATNPQTYTTMAGDIYRQATTSPESLGQLVGQNINPFRMARPVMSELDVWHGSPHRFEPTKDNPLGEFDASKIGTGEGAQAYGHGVYLAEAPQVAKGYQKRLAGSSYIDSATQIQKQSGDLWTEARNAVQNAGQAHPDRAGEIASQVQDWVDSGRSAKTFLKHRAVPKSLEPAYQAAMDAFGGAKQNTGALYKADLPDEMIGRMLDWDKPLSKQPVMVQKALRELAELGDEESNARWLLSKDNDPKTSALFKAIGNALPGVDQAATYPGSAQLSAELVKRGIPGIKYLDAGSRGQGGSGTRNFVVFPGEEKRVRILERK